MVGGGGEYRNMTTSSNITEYRLLNDDGKVVKEFRQHCLCKDTIKDRLTESVKEFPDATLVLCWPDEHEAPHYTKPMKLSDYLNGEKLEWLKYGEI